MNATRQALVVPADPLAPHRLITLPDGQPPAATFALIEREVGADVLGSSPVIVTEAGAFMYWVDDVSLLRDPLEHNDRVIALCRHVGYDVPDVAGTVVITGGPDTDPHAVVAGLDMQLLATLDATFDSLTEASAEFRATR